MNKLLIISGPTATGKTSLAIKIAALYPSVLISADSRQLYHGMDVGTGKDHPENCKIEMIDLIAPTASFSVAQFKNQATKLINNAWKQNKLPIIVGGTGQYISSLVNSNHDTFHVKPSNFLRFLLNRLSVNQLQSILKFIDSSSFNLLNHSDVHNPHRLIRKIEISLFKKFYPENQAKNFKADILHLHVTAPNDYLYQKIDIRVNNRLKDGLLDEISNLLDKYSWNSPGLNTLAYKEFKPYFLKKENTVLEECIQRWRFDEHAYARRQKVWFKKMAGLSVYDITKPKFHYRLLEEVDKWYNKPCQPKE